MLYSTFCLHTTHFRIDLQHDLNDNEDETPAYDGFRRRTT
jgi:hypothetical protein